MKVQVNRTFKCYSFLSPKKTMKKQTCSAWNFFQPTNTGTQKCVNLSLQNQHSHFLLNTLFRRVSLRPGLDQQNVNDNSVDYNHSPSGLTSRTHFSYFYTLRRTLYLSRIFAEFSLKIFQIYCVQIAGKCVCEPKYRI